MAGFEVTLRAWLCQTGRRVQGVVSSASLRKLARLEASVAKVSSRQQDRGLGTAFHLSFV